MPLRITVMEIGQNTGVADLSAGALRPVGVMAAKIWLEERQLPSMELTRSGDWEWLAVEGGEMTTMRASAPSMEQLVAAAATHRIRFSLAFQGAKEIGLQKGFDVWTYPADPGTDVITEAFKRVRAGQPRPRSLNHYYKPK